MEPPPPQPPPTCPFCAIASSHAPLPPTNTTTAYDPSATNPPAFPILSTPTVLAFLDIMPLARGHLLVAPRRHAEKMSDLSPEEASSLGAWLPVLSRVVCRAAGCEDWNVVQNNGARAAQVIPHVHFHIIPRPTGESATVSVAGRSWAMFGRGRREELDEEEAGVVVAGMREELRREVERLGSGGLVAGKL
ncbi:MAG: hypothetical protein M1839_004679 [Geoglossum umbratile]|nr:MAG: hypothetical protein M1839_004679 [Geoglossum umbratile]